MITAVPRCIAVDWGTSNLRAYLVAQNGQILDERDSACGMLSLQSYEFEVVLKALVQDWFAYQIPVLLAGMVGSRGGWQEVSYLDCPLPLLDLAQYLSPLSLDWPVPVWIVPGLKTQGLSGQTDVMRGEETQLLGLLASLEESYKCVAFCMPGTHCKWGLLASGYLERFSTTITGELFSLLLKGSSLTKGLSDSFSDFDGVAFDEGVITAQKQGGLLHQLFSVRSGWVTDERNQASVTSYLSGLVIGSDVVNMASSLDNNPIWIVGSEAVSERYLRALTAVTSNSIHCLSARKASLLGFYALTEQMS
ncbi:2-dehydro-3-deoxygalactonokinase [Marinomonas atlantica]|uniref:2-dehydro-3-deoxygalactonokinase n=1 Tax=Marinomonas atlantica TaxID=1806668 RepID=UPI00082BB2FB|nr:2-dehydro-3-deoxygalactonokinase [Marinomonas atlantica]MCO4784489.1 2-dehydro-3-deoxygalactonokinase [Marinomonas atlantica]